MFLAAAEQSGLSTSLSWERGGGELSCFKYHRLTFLTKFSSIDFDFRAIFRGLKNFFSIIFSSFTEEQVS